MSGAATALPQRAAAIQRVFLGLLVANVAVVAAKVAIGLQAGSLSVIGDAIHSSADALNNVVFIVLMRVAGREPDENHPYGHTKFEVLGALGILVFLSVSCFELLKGAIEGLAAGRPAPTFSSIDLALLAGTLAANLWIVWYETRMGRRLESDLLLADAAHTRGDVFITVGVIAGAVLSRRGTTWVDPVIAILVALLIVRLGWEIFRRAMPVLMDEVARPPAQVRQVAEGIDGVCSAYHIKSRSAAGVVFAELTIGVRADISVARAHEIADAVEERLKHALRLHEVVVHIEPC